MHKANKHACAGKEHLMRTETISPVRLIIDRLLLWGDWIGISTPSIFLFGEYEYPKKEDYLD